MEQGRASRTAVLVCQGRAVADGLVAPGRFADPVALSLLREPERAAVDRVRAGDAPAGPRQWIEHAFVRGAAEVLVPRTVTIDDAVRARAAPQLVILGAGLDSRAWRMPELAAVDVFEVDHPASQVDKCARLDDRAPVAGSVRFVPVDLTREPLDDALAAAGHRDHIPTTWVWEGVICYLTPAQVAATLRVLAQMSASGSRLVCTYQSTAPAARLARQVARVMAVASAGGNPLAGEPWRSTWTPAEMAGLLARHGFRVTSDEDLLTLADRLAVPVRARRSVRGNRVAVTDRP
jgi:methyltransferase (TIGR00027 family)